MEQARYLVIIEEKNAVGVVCRRMLVGRFVAKGDAVAYAMWRRDNDTKGWTWVVETPGAIRSLYEFTRERRRPVPYVVRQTGVYEWSAYHTETQALQGRNSDREALIRGMATMTEPIPAR